MREGRRRRKSKMSCSRWHGLLQTLFSCSPMNKTAGKMISQQNLPDIVPDMILSNKEGETGSSERSCVSTISKMRSVQNFSTRDEYLYAMKEDLADWLNRMYKVDIDAENFFEVLENGSILCQHANNVMEAIRKWRDNRIGVPSNTGRKNTPDPHQMDTGLLYSIYYRSEAKPQSFAARDNVSNFIDWARNHVAVRECLMFETDDLILRKNEENFIFCLLEIARYGSRYGVEVPRLVSFEEDIANEIKREQEQEFQSLTLLKRRQQDNQTSWISKAIQTFRHPGLTDEKDLRGKEKTDECTAKHSLDDGIYKEVLAIVSKCTCNPRLSVVSLGPGKYRIGPSLQLVFVRQLNDHLMVNVGKKWDTLKNYINELDPCRSHNSGEPSDVHEITSLDDKVDSSPDLDTDSLNESAEVPVSVNGIVGKCANGPTARVIRSKLENRPHAALLSDSRDDSALNIPSRSCYGGYGVQRRPLHRYAKAKTTQLIDLNDARDEREDRLASACSTNKDGPSKDSPANNGEVAGDQTTAAKNEGSQAGDGVGSNSGIPPYSEPVTLNSSSDSLDSRVQNGVGNGSKESVERSCLRAAGTPSRIPRLSAKDLSGRPTPRRLVLNYRRSRSMQSNESVGSSEKEFGSERPSRVPRPVRRYADFGRSQTDTVGHASPMVASPFENGNSSQESCSTTNLTSRSAGTAEAAFRENRAYRWRKKALLFRNYMQETTPRDDRALFTGELLSHHFHYPDLRGSEIIYGQDPPSKRAPSRKNYQRRRSTSNAHRSRNDSSPGSLANLQSSALI